jgi:hypothetical protein
MPTWLPALREVRGFKFQCGSSTAPPKALLGVGPSALAGSAEDEDDQSCHPWIVGGGR